ncbi:hypothetical protein CYMTET_11504 [Cymbomonas tetramitiformis]|uniref:Uncharacterized protein n=1 Tax=Cymbomonas tetramitiformis TaxID=36881 RepID=A0AAE0LCS7_9CHLO|nr:hypothetical protein CYMTET_11504 [Cymbomonas tetramitiformis]
MVKTRFAAKPLAKGGNLPQRYPTYDIACDPYVIEKAAVTDELVSTFQTAFDDDYDESFDRLRAQHDKPMLRHDAEPFTFDEDIDVACGAIPPPQHFPMVNFDSATPAVIKPPAVGHAPAEPTEPDEPAMPYPQPFIDN